ncbi:hypothetical protein SCANM63S_06884 [Streptomyces canarius]
MPSRSSTPRAGRAASTIASPPNEATTPVNWWHSRITAHSAPSPRHAPHVTSPRTVRVSQAQKWKVSPSANTLGYDTVSAREFSPRKPLQLNSSGPQRRTRLRKASAGAARWPLSVRT